MDRSSLYIKMLPQGLRLRSSVCSAIASVFFLTGNASSLGNGHQIWHGGTTERHPADPGTAAKSVRLLPTSSGKAKAPRLFLVPAPVINAESLAARLDGPPPGSKHQLPVSPDGSTLPALHRRFLPLESNDGDGATRPRAAYSSIGVFSLRDMPAETGREANTGNPHPSHTVSPRSDLLDGVPEIYAALAVRIAAEEEVDPNWVLAVMRTENAGFDRQLISPAGAIGLMQVMPQTGTAFGSTDLTDPEQNIRAGTRFLHLLIGKYRNPVLIASAYNAGEPRVDANHSLPLIRETADYVTRVVGYYTGMPAAVPAAQTAMRPQPSASPDVHRGRTERAKSLMLVFSVAEPSAALGQARQERGPIVAGGPLKIVKEEVVP